MGIFIWKSYGDIEVYATSQPHQYIKLINTIIGCIDGWDLDTTIEKVNKHMQKNLDDINELRRCVNTLLNAIGVGSHESFEDGTGFGELKE